MATQEFTPKELENETWRDVPGYEGYYQVSDLGRVRSVERVVSHSPGNEKLLKGKIIAPYDRKGYPSVFLWRNSESQPFTIHRLVMLAFVGPPPEGKEVNHISGVKTENNLDNLEYVTSKENYKHAEELGLSSSWRGKKNPKSVLEPEDVRKIRKLHATGEYVLRELAERYDVTIQSIWAIVKRETWKHVQ